MSKDFMIHYRVDNLEELLAALRANGVQGVGETRVAAYGKFAQIVDPEGNSLELWEPNDDEYAKAAGKTTPPRGSPGTRGGASWATRITGRP